MGVHDALAVVGQVPTDLLGAECAAVEIDGVRRLAVPDGEMGGDPARRSLVALVHRDSLLAFVGPATL